MVMKMRRHSTATLMGLTKKELVEYVRMAEYNQEVAEETLHQQAENVKDWVPVVRCKDCKYRRIDEDYVSGHYCVKRPSNGGYFCEDNDFCSYGERRTDNG